MGDGYLGRFEAREGLTDVYESDRGKGGRGGEIEFNSRARQGNSLRSEDRSFH